MTRLAILAAMLPGIAFAHQAHTGMVYEPWCCQGGAETGDCAPLPTSAVRDVPGGYEITLKPGDHPLVTRPHHFTVPHIETRRATDGQDHICLWPDENKVRCTYIAPRAF